MRLQRLFKRNQSCDEQSVTPSAPPYETVNVVEKPILCDYNELGNDVEKTRVY